MLESIRPQQPVEPQRGRQLRFLAQPGVLAGSAALNVVSMIVAALTWITAHRSYWQGQFDCFAYFRIGSVERWALMAATLGVAATATMLLWRIARSTNYPLPRTVVRYWLATGTLWVATGVGIYAAQVVVDSCRRGVGL